MNLLSRIKLILYGPPISDIVPIYKCPYCEGHFIIIGYEAYQIHNKEGE